MCPSHPSAGQASSMFPPTHDSEYLNEIKGTQIGVLGYTYIGGLFIDESEVKSYLILIFT